MNRSTVLVCLALVLSPLACKTNAAPSPGTTSTAEVQWHDGGGADFVFAEHKVALPDGELAAAAKPVVMQDDGAKRLAYQRGAGDVRTVAVLGGNLYFGPIVKGSLDFGSLPDVDHMLGALFENAGPRRDALVADVMKDKGESSVARMLIDGASVDTKEWDDAFAKLSEPKASEVKTALGAQLEKGKPTSGLRHAVAIVPLREPPRARDLAARIRELVDPVREPRATAVMLRALASVDKAQGAQVACDVLAKKPLDTTNARGTPVEIDVPGREALAEAAALAIALGGTDCPAEAALVGDDPCIAPFRCNDAGPLTGHEATKQDEPLCTKEQILAAAAKDLDRKPSDILSLSGGPRTAVWAYATIAGTPKVPATLAKGHARRLYAITQPKDPACDVVTPGTPCHCDEATIRDQACRHPEGTAVEVGLCKFEIDDKGKKIANVVATLPP